jgi:hypothetical protein
MQFYSRKVEDTKGVIRNVNRRTDNTIAKRKGTKEPTIFYKSLHIQ